MIKVLFYRCVMASKISGGIALLPNNEDFHVCDVIQFAVNCITVAQTRIPISFECKDDLISTEKIRTDKGWLNDNILCLLSNAVKFSQFGEVRLVCKLIDVDDTRMILIEVEDSGIGVAADMKLKLFKPFQQVKRHAGKRTVLLNTYSLTYSCA